MSVLERAQDLVDRRRLLLGLCAAVAIALIAATAGLFSGGGGGQSVQATGAAQATTPTTLSGEGVVNAEPGALPPPPSSPDATTSTTAPALVLGTVITRPTTTTAAPKPAAKPPAPAPTTQLKPTSPPAGSPSTTVCRNSYNPGCGQFRWDPDPGANQPITGQVTADNTTVRVGDKVTFTVTGTDPDAAPLQECNIDFGDNQGYHCDPRPAIDPSYCPPQYGPWTPPAKNQGTINSNMDHTYSQPGTYQVTFNVRSAMQECNNPYASSADLQITIVVTP